MSKKAISVSKEIEEGLLEGRNLKIVQEITPENGMPCGYDGKGFDWSKFDWEGKEVYIDKCYHRGCDHRHEFQACPAYVDGKGTNLEYLHVPYDYAKQGIVYRIWSVWDVGNEVRVNNKRKLRIAIEAIKAEQVDGKWAWVICYKKLK